MSFSLTRGMHLNDPNESFFMQVKVCLARVVLSPAVMAIFLHAPAPERRFLE